MDDWRSIGGLAVLAVLQALRMKAADHLSDVRNMVEAAERSEGGGTRTRPIAAGERPTAANGKEAGDDTPASDFGDDGPGQNLGRVTRVTQDAALLTMSKRLSVRGPQASVPARGTDRRLIVAKGGHLRIPPHEFGQFNSEVCGSRSWPANPVIAAIQPAEVVDPRTVRESRQFSPAVFEAIEVTVNEVGFHRIGQFEKREHAGNRVH